MPETHELPVVIEELGLEINRALARADRIERLAAGATESSLPRRRPSPTTRRWAIGGALTAALAAAVIALLFSGGGDGVGPLSTQSALAEVARAAELAPMPRADQFTHTKSRGYEYRSMPAGKDPLGQSIKPFIAMYPSERDSWISLRKRGQEVVRYGKPTYPTAADAAVGLQFETAAKESAARMKSRSKKHSLSGRSPVTGTPFMSREIETGRQIHRQMFMLVPDPATPQKMAWAPTKAYFVGGDNLTRAQLNRYPTDPKAMYERMVGRVRKGNAAFVARQVRQHHPIPKTIDPNTAVWRYLTDPSPASAPTLPPKLRAGLVRALGEIPGVTATETKDSLGRSGTAFTFTSDGIRNEAIYDPRSSALLSLKSILVDPANALPIEFKRLPAGVLLKSYLLVKQTTVNREPPSAFPPVTAHKPSHK